MGGESDNGVQVLDHSLALSIEAVGVCEQGYKGPLLGDAFIDQALLDSGVMTQGMRSTVWLSYMSSMFNTSL